MQNFNGKFATDSPFISSAGTEQGSLREERAVYSGDKEEVDTWARHKAKYNSKSLKGSLLRETT